jgi:hypothetical protein
MAIPLPFGPASTPGGDSGAAARISIGVLDSVSVPGADLAGAGGLGVLTGLAEVCCFTAEYTPFTMAPLMLAVTHTASPRQIGQIAEQMQMGTQIVASPAQERPLVKPERVQAPAHNLPLSRERKTEPARARNLELAQALPLPQTVAEVRQVVLQPIPKPAQRRAREVAGLVAEVVMAGEVATVDVQGPAAEAALTPKAELGAAEAAAEKVVAAVAAEGDPGAARVEAVDLAAEAAATAVVEVATRSWRCQLFGRQSFGNCCVGD